MPDNRMQELAAALSSRKMAPISGNVPNPGHVQMLQQEQERERQIAAQRQAEEQAFMQGLPPSAPNVSDTPVQNYISKMKSMNPSMMGAMNAPRAEPSMLAQVPGISGLIQALMGAQQGPQQPATPNPAGQMFMNNQRTRLMMDDKERARIRAGMVR